MPPQAAGSGFAVATALNRGIADLSMGDGGSSADLGATQNYEFKENDEQQQAIDDIDDFERRLAGDAPPAKPSVAKAAAPKASASRPSAPNPAPKMSGAEYVQQAKAQAGGGLKPKANRPEEEFADEGADDARQAMSDLNRFDKALGADDDDD